MRKLILIVHNVRSSYNVGSLLRTADGLGIDKVVFSGYTPYPEAKDDERLPHLARKTTNAIHKTALGAETTVSWQKVDDIADYLSKLSIRGYEIAALEQTATSQNLSDYRPPEKLALLVGNEVNGLDADLLNLTAIRLQIPMLGSKESFNVAVAAAMALYHLRFMA
jgi:23S rRNA (guanosine2251-2'-O)-methyltransferase